MSKISFFTHASRLTPYAFFAAIIIAACATEMSDKGAPQRGASVQIDGDDIGGVVTGPSGPEAGVWVIAETRELPTRFARIVVTDDNGRYVVPDLPKANYDLWVRGYGLVDSELVAADAAVRFQRDEPVVARELCGDV